MAVFYIIDKDKTYLISAKTAQKALDFVKEIKRKTCISQK